MPNMEEDTQIETKPQEVTRDKNGRWITPPKSPAPITHENARAMQKKRWDLAREAAAAAVVARAQEVKPKVTDPAGVWGLLNVHLYDKIMSSDRPRADETVILGKNIGALPAEWEKEESQGESGLESDLRGLVRLLSGALQSKLHDTIDGELKE